MAGKRTRSGIASKPSSKLAGSSGDVADERLAQVRRVIEAADPGVVEEWKWKKPSNPAGVPVWSHDGIFCVGNALKNRYRLTFPKGASLKDPKGLFNARLDSHTARAIDIPDAGPLDEGALKDLIRAAVALNASGAKKNR